MDWACLTCNVVAFRKNKSSVFFHLEGDLMYFCSTEPQTAEMNKFTQCFMSFAGVSVSVYWGLCKNSVTGFLRK